MTRSNSPTPPPAPQHRQWRPVADHAAVPRPPEAPTAGWPAQIQAAVGHAAQAATPQQGYAAPQGYDPHAQHHYAPPQAAYAPPPAAYAQPQGYGHPDPGGYQPQYQPAAQNPGSEHWQQQQQPHLRAPDPAGYDLGSYALPQHGRDQQPLPADARGYWADEAGAHAGHGYGAHLATMDMPATDMSTTDMGRCLPATEARARASMRGSTTRSSTRRGRRRAAGVGWWSPPWSARSASAVAWRMATRRSWRRRPAVAQLPSRRREIL